MLRSSRDCEFPRGSMKLKKKAGLLEVEAKCHLRAVRVYAMEEMMNPCPHHHQGNS
jgi:hypothetical protein